MQTDTLTYERVTDVSMTLVRKTVNPSPTSSEGFRSHRVCARLRVVSWVKQELVHVRELVDGGLFRSQSEAIRELRKAGVPLVGPVFAREELHRVLRAAKPTESVSDEHDPVAVVARRLENFQIGITDVTRGKAPLVRLTADPPRFVIDILNVPGKPLRIGLGDARPWARVYAAKTRRRGVAQFSANGFLEPNAAAVFFFVLVDEGQVWMLRREDLVQLDHEVRSVPKGQRAIKAAETGMAKHGDEPGSMRLWFPRGESRDLFHPAERIANEHMCLQHDGVWVVAREST